MEGPGGGAETGREEAQEGRRRAGWRGGDGQGGGAEMGLASPRPLVLDLAPTRLVLVLVLAATATVLVPPGVHLARAPSARAGPADARAGAAARASADEWYPFVEELERQANGILTAVLSTRKQAGGNHPLPILVCKRAVTTRCAS